MGRLGYCDFSMTVDDDAPMAQVFVERDFGDAQALSNLVYPAELLFAIKRLSYDVRALGFF